MEINEDNFIVELKKRNPKALEFIVDEYGGLIHSIVIKTLFGFERSGEVEECVNDILLAIWDNIEKLKHSENFKSWAAAISKYRAIDYQRRLIKTIKVEPIEGVELQEEDLTDKRVLEKENQEELIKLISKLTPEGQEIFIRRYINEESSKEIARKMDINYELVNNRLSRGRKKLRNLFLGEVKR